MLGPGATGDIHRGTKGEVMYSYEQPRAKAADESELSTKNVADIFAKSFLWLKEDINIEEAMKLLLKRDQTGAPVLDDRHRLLGFLSEKDCLKYVTEIRYLNSGSGEVRDFMSKDVEVVNLETSIFTIIDKFIKNSFHIFPVVDESSQVVGIVKRQHVLEEVSRWKTTTW